VSEISKLRNLGKASELWLNEIGVYTKADLKKLGALKAYVLICAGGNRPSLNLLWAMEGALRDLHWTEISESTKKKLKAKLPSGLKA